VSGLCCLIEQDIMDQAGNTDTTNGNVLIVSGEFHLQQPYTELWMPDGKVIRLLTTQLIAAASDDHTAGMDEVSESIVIPLLEERLDVDRRTVVTGTVKLRKVVQEYQESVEETLAVRTFDVERIILNQPIDVAPPVRQEGSATIYSVIEEQMILTKQLILKEEIRVTQRDTERHDNQVVSLTREHLVVERKPAARRREDQSEAG
jgi:stress response protein YsnF